MKARPILFSAPMVRAILDGRKTQTRRIGKIQCSEFTDLRVEFVRHTTKGYEAVADFAAFPGKGSARTGICACPYGIPGDRLWVRETWRPQDGMTMESRDRSEIEYRADGDRPKEPTDCHWKPSIFMPHWASRITLEIAGVKVERLQDISEADARAEGVADNRRAIDDGNLRYLHYGEHEDIFTLLSARESYRFIWESINGPGSWTQNPWVWVIEFSRL